MLLFKLMRNATNIKKIAAGANSQTTYILMDNGNLWAAGDNSQGVFGLNTATPSYNRWTKVASNVEDVVAGETSVLYKSFNRELFWVGSSTNGECGVSSSTRVWTKQSQPILKLLGSGRGSSFILTPTNQLLCAGLNTNGQLGINSRVNQLSWVANPLQTQSILAGSAYDHTVIVLPDGTLRGCGRNQFNQLGIADTGDKLTFINLNLPNVKMLGTGENHTIALKHDGTVWVTGRNRYGQLGTGNETNVATWTQIGINNVKAISCGVYHTLFLKNNGELWGCGRNQFGQLGIGNNLTNKTTPTFLGLRNVSYIKGSAGASYALVGTKLKVAGHQLLSKIYHNQHLYVIL